MAREMDRHHHTSRQTSSTDRQKKSRDMQTTLNLAVLITVAVTAITSEFYLS